MRQFLAAATALVVLAGVVGGAWLLLDSTLGGEDDAAEAPEAGDDATATAEAYAQAWTAGDHLSMAALVRDPPVEFAGVHQQLRDALQPSRFEVEVRAVDEDADGRATAQMDVTLALPFAESEPLAWQVDLELLRDRGQWAANWTPASVHPELRAGLVFDFETTSVERSPILAHDGIELAGSGTRVVFGFEPSAVTDPDAVVEAFEEALPGSESTAERLLARNDLVDGWFYPVVTVSQSAADAASSRLREASGILRQTEGGRTAYAQNFALHVIGRVEEATAEDLERLGEPYVAGDEVGRIGLEREFERELTGSDLITVVLRDRSDNAVRAELGTYQEQPSGPLTTTLDVTVQQALENALAGLDMTLAVVVVDATSGAIRASASRPLTGYNRAFEGRYPPGSTFKVVTAEALIADGLGAGDSVACPGDVVVGGLQVTNAGTLALGQTTLRTAFARSCNTTFAQLGGALGEEAMTESAARFGFGVEPISPLTAAGGSFPPPVDLAALSAAAFGQAEVTASVLHLASVAAAANTGVWHQPYLLAADGPGESRQLAAGSLEPLRELMRAVVVEGTGTAADLPGTAEVRGKTGTAQALDGIEHAWFIGSYGDLGFAVLVEDGGSGGEVAAPIARRFVEELIALERAALEGGNDDDAGEPTDGDDGSDDTGGPIDEDGEPIDDPGGPIDEDGEPIDDPGETEPGNG